MNVMIPTRADGTVEPRFGRAPQVSVATVDGSGRITDWQVFDVEWDRLHDEGTEGGHHARIVRFLNEHQVAACVATHAGAGMQRTLAAMGVPLLPATLPEARASVEHAIALAMTQEDAAATGTTEGEQS